MCIFKCTGLVFVMKVSEIIVYSGIDFNVQFKVNTKPKELLMGIECLLSFTSQCYFTNTILYTLYSFIVRPSVLGFILYVFLVESLQLSTYDLHPMLQVHVNVACSVQPK